MSGSGRCEVVTLHSSWRGILLSFGGCVILVGLAVLVSVREGGVAGLVLWSLAVIAVLVTGLDLPIATEFGSNGLTRRALLRHQHIAFERIVRVTRARVGIIRTAQGPSGGLVAEVGRRRYLLIDKRESQIEFDEIRRVLGHDRADALGLSSELRPPDGVPPTWLYRRKKWRPLP